MRSTLRPAVVAAGWLRRNLLLVVLAAGWIFMIMLTVEQDRTITTQSELIHSLNRDSLELNALKLHRLNPPSRSR